MKQIFLLFAFLSFCALTVAQNARVQVIHNSPTPGGGPTAVDVYIDDLNEPALDSFTFRTATPFLDLPAGDRRIVVAANGEADPENNNVFDETVTLMDGETYVVVATGVVGDATTPFKLAINDMAREAAEVPALAEFTAFHGSPDAPAVDVDARGLIDEAIDNLAYSEFTDYIGVPPAVYTLDVRANDDSNIVAAFEADLNGLGGGAATVFASGFLGQDPGFGLFAALPDGTVVEFPQVSSSARVQVIHNSPTPGGGPTAVDVYIDDLNAPALDSFTYRTATPFLDLPAGDRRIVVAANGEADPENNNVADATVTLLPGETYVVVANGVVGDATTPFTLALNDMGQEAAGDPANVEFAAFHGSPDAPAVDVDARGVADELVDNLPYNEFTDYIGVPPAVYTLDVRANDDPNVVAAFEADLSGLGGGAATVFASGFLGQDPGFGLFAALPDGTVVEFPQVSSSARVQVIHNSPTPGGGPTAVDVYINDFAAPALDSFTYRTATPFLDIQPGMTRIVVAPNGESDPENNNVFDATLPLEIGQTYVAIANGVVGDATTPFTLAINNMAREAAEDTANVEFAAFHGSPDAPAVDVDARGVADELIDSLAYNEFTDYIGVPPATYTLDVRANDDPNIVAAFEADLNGLGGGAATVFASGFLGQDPGFGLFAALPDGTVVEFPRIADSARVQVIHNSPTPGGGPTAVDVYIDDFAAPALDSFTYRTATPFLDLPAGDRRIVVAANGEADPANNNVADATVTLLPGATYVVVANGVVGDGTTPFVLAINDMAREAAEDPANVEFAAFHGSPDAPAVDVDARGVADELVDSLAYNEFTDYIGVPPAGYILDVRADDDPNIVGTFLADLSGLGGGAATVFASGFLGQDPGFGLFAALPDGTVVEFPAASFANANVIHASPAAAADSVDVYLDTALAIDNFPYLASTGYFQLPTDLPISVNTKGSTGSDDGVVLTIPANTLENAKDYIVIVHGDGSTEFPIEAAFIDTARTSSTQPGLEDVIAFHGIPGLGAVDVRDGLDLPDFATLIDGLGYGEFSDYLSVPADNYSFRFTGDDNASPIATFLTAIDSTDEAGILVATGLPDSDPLFNLYYYLPDGTRFAATTASLIQLIHNSPAADFPVDVLALDDDLSGFILAEGLDYTGATTFDYFLTRSSWDYYVGPQGFTSLAEVIVTFEDVELEDGKDYTAVVYGDGQTATPLSLAVLDTSRLVEASGSVFDLMLFHGSPDAGPVDVSALGMPVLDDFSYGTFEGYLPIPLNIPVQLDVTSGDGSEDYGSYIATFSDWTAAGYSAGTAYATGYLDPDMDQPGFELWIAFWDGTTEMLERIVNVEEVEATLSTFDIFPNPMSHTGTVQYSVESSTQLQGNLFDANGRLIRSENLGNLSAGMYTHQLNVTDLPNGTYYYQLHLGDASVTKRFIVTK